MKLKQMMRAVAVAAIVSVTTLANAQSWPSQPVKLIVGFSPGGTIDVVARIIGEQLQAKLGQPFVVENRTGANGMLAAEAVANAAPDGYSVFVSNSSTITLNPALFQNLKYNPERDFAPVTSVLSVPLILAVNPENPNTANINTIEDLIAAAKAAPGEVLYGSAGNGNITHLAFELLSQRAGIKMTHLPYKGAAAAQAAALSQEVAVIFDTLSAIPQIKAGKLRPLAVSSAERLPMLPDVPTVAEKGFPGFNVGFWVGFFLPKDTPQDIIDKLAAEITAAGQDPVVQEKLSAQGSVVKISPAEFAEQIRKETAELADVVQKANIKAD
ncbi:Bug family tripartite tricarboxylate transporter substrate binding protein [Mesorhizobium sp. 1B3]|uniref:Bug family tripartite tricarboxylate transporter substrate binding protein n=1 Tax=Mesorhizobium sp. 1B3 TaxID=3243599 RepID=UPI003D96A8A4